MAADREIVLSPEWISGRKPRKRTAQYWTKRRTPSRFLLHCDKCDKKSARLCSLCRDLFGEYRGVDRIPILGRNFDNISICFFTPKRSAKMILDEIITYTGMEKISVLEICAGIGGQTLAMLESPYVEEVVAFEMHKLRREILLRNVRDFGFMGRDLEVKSEFNINEDAGRGEGKVTLIDPPWILNPICVCSHNYIKEGMKLGDELIEVVIKKLLEAGSILVAVKLPLVYELGEIPLTKVRFRELGKLKLAMCTPL